MAKADKSVDILKLMRGEHKPKPPQDNDGLRIVKVSTTEPDPITFVFEGSKTALDLELFEIPVDFYPLRPGDRLLVFPIVGGQRWAAIQKINGGLVLATMAGPDSLTIEGINKTYTAAELVIPPYFAVGNQYSHYTDEDIDTHDGGTDTYTNTSDDYLLKDQILPLVAGDKVSIAPTWDTAAEAIKYVILERY